MQAQQDEDNHIPFAKCSRVVSRSLPLSLPSQNLRMTPQHYEDFLWENLTQRPSPTWMEEPYIPQLLPGVYRPEGLLPPEMLCRRKKKKSHLSAMQQGHGGIPARVKAVTYHLEDLRRRQRIANELKKTQWGSSGAASESQVLREDGCGFTTTTQYHDLEEETATTKEDHCFPPVRAQLLWSPWSPLGREGSCLSRQLSSLAPYSTVTACRNRLYNP